MREQTRTTVAAPAGATRRSTRWWAAAAGLAAALAACAARPLSPSSAPPTSGSGTTPGSAAAPTLVVLVTIDQFRADYLERFGPQLSGGLARLVAGGAHFVNARHDHAITETAPGHATLLSGRVPRSTGIISNEFGVDDPDAPLIDGAPGDGASPLRFRGSAFADWLAARDRRTKALGISSKARSAILPLGRFKGEAYWYAANGRFTTSRYYADALPEWVRRFNANDYGRRSAGSEWTLLRPAADYPEDDSVSFEGLGHDVLFPHRFPSDSGHAAGYVTHTPRMDEILLAMALDGVRERGLGAGSHTDLLSVSLSATDAIGHLYGPDSREMHDQVLRLDRTLGVFLDSLYRLRDPSRVVVVLSSDHGVAPIPELSAKRGVQPTPMRIDADAILWPARERLRKARADTNLVASILGLVVFDRKGLARARIDADSLRDAIARTAGETPGVLRVDRFDAIVAADASRDSVARRWANQIPPQAAVELIMTLAPYNIWWSDNVASHQTPHDYDTRVPLIFYGAPFRPGRYADPVRTIDLAPTLAAALGIRPAERLDGVPLRAAIR